MTIDKHPRQISQCSQEEHYAILTDNSFSYDDGYGSANNPSMSTARSIDMEVYETKDEVIAWIERNSLRSPPVKFRLVKITPMKVNTTVSVDVC